MIAPRDLQQHVVVRRVLEEAAGRARRHVRGVAVRIGAVPQRLDEVEDQHPLRLVGIEGVEHARVSQLSGWIARVERGRVERRERLRRDVIARARQQDRVIHPRDAQRAALDVDGDGAHRAAVDPALAIAVVVHAARVDERAAVGILERRIRTEALRMDHQPGQVQEVELTLLRPVDEEREARQVRDGDQRVRDVGVGEPEPVRGAVHHREAVGHLLLGIRIDLARAAEQPVAVLDRPQELVVLEAGPSHVADEVRLIRLPGDLLRGGVGVGRVERELTRRGAVVERGIAAQLVAFRRGRARGRDVAGHRERAGDPHRHLVVLPGLAAGRVAGRVGPGAARRAEAGVGRVHRELGSASLHRAIGQVGVTERLERVVADGQHAAGQALAAGHGEVPRQIEAAARDPGPAQRLEQALHVRACKVSDFAQIDRIFVVNFQFHPWLRLTQQVKGWLLVSRFLSPSMVVHLRFDFRF